jgi:hypothetical protein
VTRLSILGMGQVSACGRGVEPLRAALGGKAPQATWLRHPGVARGEAVPVFTADGEGIDDIIGRKLARRLDPFSKRFVLAARLAVEDSGLELNEPERVGAVAVTGYGPLRTSFSFLDDIIAEGDGLGSPFLFSASVHNAPASAIAAVMGVQGPTLTLTAFAHGWARAIETAAGWLGRDRVDRVIVAAGDEYHEMVAVGQEARGCTYVPGETFAALLLARDDRSPAQWGHVEQPFFFHSASELDSERFDGPLFLGAKGDNRAGAMYRDVAARHDDVQSFAHLWGANPTSDAMNMLAAAIMLRDRLHDPVKCIHCVSCDAPAEGVVLTVR